MVAKPKVMIDINIVLDVLQRREPFYETSMRLLVNAETGRIHGWLAAHSLTTLFYLIAKDQTPEHARTALISLLQFIRVATVDQAIIGQALNLPYRDFEDAVQMMAAVQGKLDFLVTRNPKDYQPALIPVLQPVEFLATL